jgi:hypothetical protein
VPVPIEGRSLGCVLADSSDEVEVSGAHSMTLLQQGKLDCRMATVAIIVIPELTRRLVVDDAVIGIMR